MITFNRQALFDLIAIEDAFTLLDNPLRDEKRDRNNKRMREATAEFSQR